MPAPLVLAPVVGFIMAWFARLMMLKLGVWIVGAMVYLGIYFGTQELVIGPLLDQVQSIAEGNVTGALAGWVSFLNFDRAITMVISAYSTAGAIAATKMALFRR